MNERGREKEVKIKNKAILQKSVIKEAQKLSQNLPDINKEIMILRRLGLEQYEIDFLLHERQKQQIAEKWR